MLIIDVFNSDTDLSITTTNKNQINIKKDDYCVKLDEDVFVIFTGGAKQYYKFIGDAKYSQPGEIMFDNIISDDNAIIDTVDEDVSFRDKKIYSSIILLDFTEDPIYFLMSDEEG
jgi:hypothetical protein